MQILKRLRYALIEMFLGLILYPLYLCLSILFYVPFWILTNKDLVEILGDYLYSLHKKNKNIINN